MCVCLTVFILFLFFISVLQESSCSSSSAKKSRSTVPGAKNTCQQEHKSEEKNQPHVHVPARVHENILRPNKKRSLLRLTRPTVFWSADRTLFFDFASDTFWRRSVRGQLRRRSQSRERSRRVKIKQREGDLDCWPRLWAAIQARVEMCAATRSTERDFCRLQHIVHHFRFLRLAASTSKLTRRSFSSFWPIRSCPALISCFSSTAMPEAESVNFPADKKPFCRGRLLHVDGDATCCGLRLEITRLWITRFAFKLQRPDEAGEDRRHVFFTSSSKTIKRSSRRRSSRQRTRARYTYVRGRPSNITSSRKWRFNGLNI